MMKLQKGSGVEFGVDWIQGLKLAGCSLSPLLHVWFLLSASMCKPHFLLHVVDCLACHYHNWRVKKSLCLHFPLGKFMVGLWSCLSYILSPDLVSICSTGGDRYVKRGSCDW